MFDINSILNGFDHESEPRPELITGGRSHGAKKSAHTTGDTKTAETNDLTQLTAAYDMIPIKRDPMFEDLIKATEIVREFVIRNGLIIYGGTAIDMALRLCGDKIYDDDMLQVPDLDFYSPNSIEHSYELADILYAAGFTEVRSINAIHFTARKVDIGDNHFVADIAYMPASIFERLPTLVFGGMKIIHPTFQRIDMHSAFSFPYANAPGEVVFQRWRKDFKRFWKLNAKYPVDVPVDVPSEPADSQELVIPDAVWSAAPLAGWCAFAIMTGRATHRGGAIVLRAPRVELLCDTKPDGASSRYDRYHSILEPVYEATIAGLPVHMWDLHESMITVDNHTVGPHNVTTISMHAIAKYLLAMYFKTGDSAYIGAYASILPRWSLSIKPWGAHNMSTMKKVQLAQQDHDIYGTALLTTPRNYHPARGNPHPTFDISQSEFFNEEGIRREIVP